MSSPLLTEEPVIISIDITPEMIRQSLNDIPIITKLLIERHVSKISKITNKD